LESASVKDNRLLVHQEDYQCLIVPYSSALPTAMIQSLVQFAEQGLEIFFIEGLPSRSSEGYDVADHLAYLAGHPKVKLVPLNILAQDLLAKGYYEIRVDSYQPYLRNYHYQHGDLDVWMFFNEHPYETIDGKVGLTNQFQGDVYAYDAYLNQLSRIKTVREEGTCTVQLTLSPYESIVLLFGEDFDNVFALPQQTVGVGFELTGEWNISIAEAEQYPNFREWGKLAELSNMSRPDYLPRFSGTFRYEMEFEWNNSSELALIELGEVYETAEVWLNGEQAGVRICPPYRLEVSGLLKKGVNRLVIEVTNTLAKDQRDFLSAFAQQEPSGLIGPVTVRRITV
jgi:hypothetical protein